MFKYSNIEELSVFLSNDELHFSKEEELLSLKDGLIVRHLPKRKGGHRKVYLTSNLEYELVSDSIRDEICKNYSCPSSVFWYIKGKSIVDNARVHLNSKIIINLDIKDFFESITTKCIKDCLICYGVNKDIAMLLANFMTIDDGLITGSSFAPSISNLIFLPIDKEIESFCNMHNKKIRYSRYADDLTFSCIDKLEHQEVHEIISNIKDTLQKYNFIINDKKTKVYTKRYAQYVTWLTVNDDKYPRVPKKLKRKFRLATYYMKKFWIDNIMLSNPYSKYFFRNWYFSYDWWLQRLQGIEWNCFKKSIDKVIEKTEKISKDNKSYDSVSLEELLEWFSV